MWQWCEGEWERRAVLHRATCLYKAFTTQRDQPTSQMPHYLMARVAAGHAVPLVEVVLPQPEAHREEEQTGPSGRRKAADEREVVQGQGAEAAEEEEGKEVHAVLEYVVKGLNEELLTELLEGFRSEA